MYQDTACTRTQQGLKEHRTLVVAELEGHRTWVDADMAGYSIKCQDTVGHRRSNLYCTCLQERCINKNINKKHGMQK